MLKYAKAKIDRQNNQEWSIDIVICSEFEIYYVLFCGELWGEEGHEKLYQQNNIFVVEPQENRRGCKNTSYTGE